MIVLTSLLLWTSLGLIGGASAGNTTVPGGRPESCYSNLALKLHSEESNEGWNGLGRGFLGIFTPAKMTDEHWQMIEKIYGNKDFSQIKGFVFSLGGVVFLVVVSVLLLLLFCAAPISLCVFSCTCKKKCKPKTNKIITFTGIGCNCVAMLTIFLAILFCFLSLGSITDGVERIGDSVKPLPDLVVNMAAKMKGELQDCGIKSFVSSVEKSIDEIPAKISAKISEIQEIKDVMKIDFKKYQATIDGFSKKPGEINLKIDVAKNKLNEINNQLPGNLLDKPLANLDDAKKAMTTMNSQFDSSAPGDDSIKKKLDKAEEHRSKASKSEIEKTVKDKIGETTKDIKNIDQKMKKKIDDGFKKIDKAKEKISSMTKEISSNVDKIKDKLSYMQAINLVLLPCYLALISAIWSTHAASKFVPKKKAKPKEKIGLLIPLAIGLALAFLPLLSSTAFMGVAGVTNVACGTFFKDDSFGFLPKALSVFKVNPNQTFSGIEVDIPSVIQECKNHETFIVAVKADKLLPEDVSKRIDINAEKAKMIQKLNEPLGLPDASEWKAIEQKITDIATQRADADHKINDLENFALPPALFNALPAIFPNQKITDLQEVKAVVEAVRAFSDEVKAFEGACTADIGIAEKLTDEVIRKEMKKMVNGEVGKDGLLEKVVADANVTYAEFREKLLTTSTNCNFIFTLFDSFGEIFCGQALGGLNGVYAAIGLGVFSFFSATCGTVMIWHSLRAGKGVKEEEKKSDEDKKKKKKKKGKGEGGEEGGEEEEEDTLPPPPEPVNMVGKVGEVAQPMQIKPQQGQVDKFLITLPQGGAPAQVQAVPTDKTNPSLLPSDVLPSDPPPAAGAPPTSDPTAGTPVLSPNPIQMVKIEENDDKQNSITGAGGETQGGATAPQ